MKENIFDRLNNWVNNTEGSLVNFLTAFSPWLAPLAPAYMTYDHMVKFLQFPQILAVSLALVVEILGFGTVSTFLDFWFFNRRNRAKGKKAPIWAVVISFGFYLGLIVVSNVIIDVAKEFGTPAQQSSAIVTVRALLTLQTIPAAIIVGVRTGHRELLREIKVEKQEKVSERNPKEPETFVPKVNDWRKLKPMLSPEEMYSMAYLSSAEISEVAQKFGVTERTVENWRNNAREEIGVK